MQLLSTKPRMLKRVAKGGHFACFGHYLFRHLGEGKVELVAYAVSKGILSDDWTQHFRSDDLVQEVNPQKFMAEIILPAWEELNE